MQSKRVQVGQYAFETKYLGGDNEEFLESIAPLIGYIVYEFNSLEEILTSFICQIISDRADDKGLIITHKMAYSQKVELFNRLTTWTQRICEKEVPIHEEFIKKLRECGRLRNMVVHAEWDSVDDEGYTLVKLRINKNGIEQEYVQFDEDSLKKIQEMIIETYNQFDDYEEQYQSLTG